MQAVDDSLPVLELATQGGPGVALHAGTGSFVALRTPAGAVHYAGGLGWRFGDEGSGVRRQPPGHSPAPSWNSRAPRPPSALGDLVADRTGSRDLPTLIDRFYRGTAPNARDRRLHPRGARPRRRRGRDRRRRGDGVG